MAVYLKTGHEPKNVYRITSKAFYIYRKSKVIYRKWGAISVEGHTRKKIAWEKGYPRVKNVTFNSTEEAREFARVSVLRVLAKGYHKTELRITNIL